MDVVFKSNSCPNCVIVENAVRNSRLPIAIANIDVDSGARIQFDSTGSRAVPTAIVDGRVYVGASAILAALRGKFGRI